jgi:Bacterial RNA polymerase, alpha chain C terminal domain
MGCYMRFTDVLNHPVEQLELTVRCYVCLKKCNIETVGALAQKTEGELLQTGNFDMKSLFEVKMILGEMGLTLGLPQDSPKWFAGDQGFWPPESELRIGDHYPHPPKYGEFLLYLFLKRKDRENVIGDLVEEYSTIILPKFGVLKASLWFWKQVASSIMPLLWPRMKRLAQLAGAAKMAQEVLKWMRS